MAKVTTGSPVYEHREGINEGEISEAQLEKTLEAGHVDMDDVSRGYCSHGSHLGDDVLGDVAPGPMGAIIGGADEKDGAGYGG